MHSNFCSISPIQVFASKPFNSENKLKGFLIMEYISDSVVKHAVENITLEELDKVGQ